MPFLQIIATKSYGFVHLDFSPEDKIESQNQDQMRHHGKSVHKPGYNGIRSSVGHKCPEQPNELTVESADSHFTVKWRVCFRNGVDAVATASLVLLVMINIVTHIPCSMSHNMALA
jgi:hypothetical protein